MLRRNKKLRKRNNRRLHTRTKCLVSKSPPDRHLLSLNSHSLGKRPSNRPYLLCRFFLLFSTFLRLQKLHKSHKNYPNQRWHSLINQKRASTNMRLSTLKRNRLQPLTSASTALKAAKKNNQMLRSLQV